MKGALRTRVWGIFGALRKVICVHLEGPTSLKYGLGGEEYRCRTTPERTGYWQVSVGERKGSCSRGSRKDFQKSGFVHLEGTTLSEKKGGYPGDTKEEGSGVGH